MEVEEIGIDVYWLLLPFLLFPVNHEKVWGWAGWVGG
jgi:hypothetical protein